MRQNRYICGMLVSTSKEVVASIDVATQFIGASQSSFFSVSVRHILPLRDSTCPTTHVAVTPLNYASICSIFQTFNNLIVCFHP